MNDGNYGVAIACITYSGRELTIIYYSQHTSNFVRNQTVSDHFFKHKNNNKEENTIVELVCQLVVAFECVVGGESRQKFQMSFDSE